MKKILFYVLVLTSLFVNAQEENNEFYITRDNKKLGKRTALILSFSLGLSRKELTYFDNVTDYSSCYLSTLCRNLTLSEIRKLSANNRFSFSKKQIIDNDSLSRLLGNCFWENSNDKGKAAFEKSWIKNCKKDIKKNKSFKESKAEPEDFCKCLKAGIEEKGFNIAGLPDMSNEYSIGVNEYYFPCLNRFAEDVKLVSKIKKNALENVIGKDSIGYIELIKIFRMDKVKVFVSNKAFYFIIDSGASDVQINAELGKKWKKEKVLTEDLYLGTSTYTLADGSKESCKRYLVNGWKIGNYTVNNIVVAVAKKDDAAMLLGKSFFDNFKGWHIDNVNHQLILEN